MPPPLLCCGRSPASPVSLAGLSRFIARAMEAVLKRASSSGRSSVVIVILAFRFVIRPLGSDLLPRNGWKVDSFSITSPLRGSSLAESDRHLATYRKRLFVHSPRSRKYFRVRHRFCKLWPLRRGLRKPNRGDSPSSSRATARGTSMSHFRQSVSEIEQTEPATKVEFRPGLAGHESVTSRASRSPS